MKENANEWLSSAIIGLLGVKFSVCFSREENRNNNTESIAHENPAYVANTNGFEHLSL